MSNGISLSSMSPGVSTTSGIWSPEFAPGDSLGKALFSSTQSPKVELWTPLGVNCLCVETAGATVFREGFFVHFVKSFAWWGLTVFLVGLVGFVGKPDVVFVEIPDATVLSIEETPWLDLGLSVGGSSVLKVTALDVVPKRPGFRSRCAVTSVTPVTRVAP